MQKASECLTLLNKFLLCTRQTERKVEKLVPLEEARVTIYPTGLDAYHTKRKCCLSIFLYYEDDAAEPVVQSITALIQNQLYVES